MRKERKKAFDRFHQKSGENFLQIRKNARASEGDEFMVCPRISFVLKRMLIDKDFSAECLVRHASKCIEPKINVQTLHRAKLRRNFKLTKAKIKHFAAYMDFSMWHRSSRIENKIIIKFSL